MSLATFEIRSSPMKRTMRSSLMVPLPLPTPGGQRHDSIRLADHRFLRPQLLHRLLVLFGLVLPERPAQVIAARPQEVVGVDVLGMPMVKVGGLRELVEQESAGVSS